MLFGVAPGSVDLAANAYDPHTGGPTPANMNKVRKQFYNENYSHFPVIRYFVQISVPFTFHEQYLYITLFRFMRHIED